ncbi:hypothetical protein KQI63_04285 [bacterium]|nr:hypothetical protein [bacterium]
MKRSQAWFAGTVLLFAMMVSGCATHYQLSPIGEKGDDIYTSKGKQVITREEVDFRVAVSVYKVRSESHTELYVFCENLSDHPVEFDPEQIEVYVDMVDGHRPVTVIPKRKMKASVDAKQSINGAFFFLGLFATIVAPPKRVETDVETDEEGNQVLVEEGKTDWGATFEQLGDVTETHMEVAEDLGDKENEIDALMDAVTLQPGESADGVIHLQDRMVEDDYVVVNVPIEEQLFSFRFLVEED